MLRQKFLKVCLDTVLDQSRIETEFIRRIVLDLFESDPQFLARLVGDDPQDVVAVPGGLDQPARRTHPVERLVRPIVGMDTDRAVGFDQQQSSCGREVGGQASHIVDTATSNN